MPLDMIKQIMEIGLGQLQAARNANEEELAANVEMHSLMYARQSVVDIVQMIPHRWLCYASHPLQSDDRLGNKDFPIAMAFGDRDFFGTEGAD